MMDDLLSAVIDIAIQAGQAILPFYRKSFAIQEKKDHTPLTKADLAAHDVIEQALNHLVPYYPLISEEGLLPDVKTRQSFSRFWLVDPLDGTRGFIAGNAEFSVNIALIDGHESVLGVIYAPVSQDLYYATKGQGAFYQKNQITQRIFSNSSFSLSNARLAIGHYHGLTALQALCAQYPAISILRLNSSLKFTCLAANYADIYPRLGPTSEWDTAAGQCILEEAGGAVVDLQGERLRYNARESLENPPFVAMAAKAPGLAVLHYLNRTKE